MSNQWSQTTRNWVLSGLAVVIAISIWYGRELISPLVIGALLAFVLNPAIGVVTRYTKLTRSLASTVVLLLGLGGLVTLSVLITPRLVDEIQVLFLDLQGITSQIEQTFSQPIIFLEWTINLEYLFPDFNQLFSEIISSIPENAFLLLEATSKNFIWGLVIVATVYYLLRDWERLRNWVFEYIPEGYQPDARHLYRDIRQIWQGYLRGNLALMTVVAIMFSLAWLAIGLPGALILGLIAGLLTIIPDLGPAIAAILATAVALFEGSTYLNISNFWFALLVIGVYMLLINIKGIWIRPRIFARSVHMHDGIVFVAIMAAVVIQGILGALVIVPVLASGGILARYVYHQLVGNNSPYKTQ